MGIFLSKRELAQTEPAERLDFKSPVPTRMVSNGEFNPLPQTQRQRQFEERLKDLSEAGARKLGMDRRQFLCTSYGMAAAFVALNDVFGPIFDVSLAEAAQPEAAAERANGLAGQFILDDQVHFVRDDYKVEDILGLAKYAGQHWNPSLLKDTLGVSLDRYKFENFLKEVYLDSDTKVALLSGAPFDNPAAWFLSNDQIKLANQTVNNIAGSKRLLFHSLFTPAQPGWDESPPLTATWKHPLLCRWERLARSRLLLRTCSKSWARRLFLAILTISIYGRGMNRSEILAACTNS